MRSLCIKLSLALLFVAAPADAQEAQRPSTTVVEILGLRSWTREMVEDSVARFQPGVSLSDHACAVILRDSVGFANAASIGYDFGEDTIWSVLPVVEPARRAQVRFATYTVRRRPHPEWADLFAALEAHPQAFGGLQYPGVLLAEADSGFGQPLPPGTDVLRRAIRAHASPRDWELARDALLADSSYANRTAAALVLSNFAHRDSAYYLLAEGLRAVDRGSSASGLVLRSFTRDAPRPVDWEPARATLQALFGGTNLFSYTQVMETLVATQVDPALGRDLARVDTVLLLDHLGARNPATPGPVNRYLAHVYGRDLGRDPAAWNALLSAP